MALNKFIMAVVFLVLTATAASAYTLVMRNGRRIEIPNEFTISGSTLTYEVGTGIQMTFQLSGIDIAATERANGEQSGSFLGRASGLANVPAQPSQTQPRAQRSITNRDLEGYRRTRIESEIAYEKRRKELGLPSVQEARREVAAITERTRTQLLSMRSDNDASEEYWRSRASSLRGEMAVAQAQIDYVRRRLDEIPVTNSFGPVLTNSAFGLPGLNQYPLSTNVFGSSIFNTGRLNMGQRRFPGRYNRFRNRGRYNNVFGSNVVAAPFETFDYNEERAELVNRLNELQMNQAGLNARWRELEDEARRAGAYPGWLRP
jgi:hypothetical protein